MTNDSIIITVVNNKYLNRELRLTMNWDADINDWIETFKTILTHQTFCPETIKELFEHEDYSSNL
jgi:hypothetical protein